MVAWQRKCAERTLALPLRYAMPLLFNNNRPYVRGRDAQMIKENGGLAGMTFVSCIIVFCVTAYCRYRIRHYRAAIT